MLGMFSRITARVTRLQSSANRKDEEVTVVSSWRARAPKRQNKFATIVYIPGKVPKEPAIDRNMVEPAIISTSSE
jgi:hypothetical protein